MFIIIFMNRIRDLREEYNLTQTDLAKAVNTSQRNISRWEKGEIEMGANFAIALAKYFNVSVEYLLGLSDEYDFPILTIDHLPEKKKAPIAERTQLSEIQENFISEFKEFFSEKTFWKYAQLYQAMDRDTRIFALGYLCSYLKNVGMNVDAFLK